LIKIILVRHGETEWNVERRIQGGLSDTPLSETGKKQAENLALRLKDQDIRAIYSSPLQRALNTARAIAKYYNLEVLTHEGLKEINVGTLEGVLASEITSHFDAFVCRRDGLENFISLPEGESLLDVQQRAWQTLQGFTENNTEGTIVVVTHYFVIMSVICKVLNLPLCEMVHLKLGTGSISSFLMDQSIARLEVFNDSCHNQNQVR
jgi:broad specificity phosphatase PhoE